MSDPDTFRPLFEAQVKVVARAAECFQLEDPSIDPAFWETLYGPFGDGPLDFGMLDWGGDDYGDC